MSKQKQKTSESRNWAGMRTMGSMQESLIGMSTIRQAIGITISAATSLCMPCLFIPKNIEPCLLAKHKTNPHTGVSREIERSEVK